MVFTQSLWQFILFLIIVLGPLPLAHVIVFTTTKENSISSTSKRLLTAGLLWCIIQTSITLLLGIAHHLELNSVIAVEIGIALVGLLMLRHLRRDGSYKLSNYYRSFTPLNSSEMLVIGAAVYLLIVLMSQTIRNPTLDYDSLSYHLPVVASCYQSHSISIPNSAEILQVGFPYNWELIGTLFVMPFKSDIAILIPSLISWLLFGLVIYSLAKMFGAIRLHAMAAAVLVMAMPLVSNHVNAYHIDLAFSFLFLASLYFSILYCNGKKLSNAILGIASAALMLGIKMSGFVYMSVPIAILCIGALPTHRKSTPTSVKQHNSSKVNLILGTAEVLCFLFIGSFWYVRNYINIGNPLGYVEVRLCNNLLFSGVISEKIIHKSTLAYLFSFTNFSHWSVLAGAIYERLGIPLIAIAAQIAWCFTTIRSKKGIQIHWALVTLFLLTIGLYWITPYSGQLTLAKGEMTSPVIGRGFRFAFSAIGLCGVLGAVCATRSSVSKYMIVSIVLASIALATFESRLTPLGVITLLGCGIYHILSKHYTLPRYAIPWRTATFILIPIMLLCITPIGLHFIHEKQAEERVIAYGGLSEYISNHTRPNETIGYLLSHQSYLFYGNDLSRKVIYCIPSESDNLSQWIDQLKQQNISIIAAGPLIKRWASSREIVWLNDPNGPFVRIFGSDINNSPVLYRIRTDMSVKRL